MVVWNGFRFHVSNTTYLFLKGVGVFGETTAMKYSVGVDGTRALTRSTYTTGAVKELHVYTDLPRSDQSTLQIAEARKQGVNVQYMTLPVDMQKDVFGMGAAATVLPLAAGAVTTAGTGVGLLQVAKFALKVARSFR